MLTAACRDGSHAPPMAELRGVEVGNCAEVVAGPVCRVGDLRTLRIFVPANATEPKVTSDAGPLLTRATSLADGARLEVDVPAGAARLDVSATVGGAPAQYTLRLGAVPPLPAWLDDAFKRVRAGDGEGATRELDEGERSSDASDGFLAAQIASFRARDALSSGEAARAAELFAKSADLHAARGETSAASLDESARAYVLIDGLHDFDAAHASLARLATFGRDYPEGGVAATYNEGLLALATRNIGAGLASLVAALDHATHIGDESLAAAAEDTRAAALTSVGRIDEAFAIQTKMDAERGQGMHPCDRAVLRVNLGEAILLARDQRGVTAMRSSPAAPLHLAEEAYRTTCLNAEQRAQALLDLAWASLQDGALADARRSIAAAHAASPHLEWRAGLFALDLEGQVALAAGNARAALATYRDLSERAAGLSTLDEARAAQGESLARERMGDPIGALSAVARAEALFDEAALSVPIGEGRGAFWWLRARVTRRRVTLLLAAGKVDEAFEVARAARAKLHEDVQRSSRGATLPPDARARWEHALADYDHARDDLVASAHDDWSLSADALVRASASRHVRDLALRDKLDAVARDVFPAASEVGTPRPALATEDGAIGLAWYPLDDAWAAFRVLHASITAHVIAAPTDPARAGEAAAILLASEAAPLRAAKRIRWLPFDALDDVDVAALVLDGAPLLERAPVEYVLESRFDAPRGAGGAALVVADPTGALPAARREGVAVAAALDGGSRVTLLVGADATRARVLAELSRASSFHYSGHAVYAGADGWDSALLLANGDSVGVADVLALSRAPGLVVLSGCETGTARSHGGAPGVGLSEAFIAAGSGAVIGASRRVRDEVAEALLVALTPALAVHPNDAASALRDAQLALRRDQPGADWSAYRAFVRH